MPDKLSIIKSVMSFIGDIARPLLGRSTLINASDPNPLEGLNPTQKKAVRYIDGPLLVLASAGCCKTSVITHKIAWLIKQCGYRAGNVTAVTFTNKAAREMKERVSNLLPHDDNRGLTVCTFHQLALKIIQREAHAIGRKSGFTIFDDQDSKALLKELLLNHGGAVADITELALQQISHWKNCLLYTSPSPRDLSTSRMPSSA